jgi:uncharacterized membrane protein YedE/YeeE
LGLLYDIGGRIVNLVQVAIRGALIGIPLGYVMQRTNLCFNSAYREALLKRDTVLLRVILLAVLVQMVGLALLLQFGVGDLELAVVPFWPLAAAIGGFVFGIGMVYASGCSSTIWYRIGNGNLGALTALVGFAIGEAATNYGPLSGMRAWLQGTEVTLSGGVPATLPNALGLDPWWVVIPIVLVAGWWLARQRAGSYLGGWDWKRAGVGLGLIGALAWIVAWPTGWQYGIGIVGATGNLLMSLFWGPGALNWGSFVVLTMPVGAFFAAWQMGDLSWKVPRPRSALRMLIAGVVMGASAAVAGGCNTGHSLTGVPTLALSSLTATLAIFCGAWLGNCLRWVRRVDL